MEKIECFVGILLGLICAAFIVGLAYFPCTVLAASPEEMPYYRETADGGAWTIDEPMPLSLHASAYYTSMKNQFSFWGTWGEWIRVGGTPENRKPGVGQHFYSYDRTGEVELGGWKCQWVQGRCQHQYTLDWAMTFHGYSLAGPRCGYAYWSGWVPYCRDCGEEVYKGYFYLSREIASQIDRINLDKDYYYLCPMENCRGVETAIQMKPHKCKGISENQYKVVYEKGSSQVQGKMQPSFHMYNDATVYEGRSIVPQTTLSAVVGGNSLDSLSWPGHVFLGWAINPGGPVVYEDGATIRNLTNEQYDMRQGEEIGVVHLYAVWKEACAYLTLDAGEGTYLGEHQKILELAVSEEYRIYRGQIKPPLGHLVSFRSGGGEAVPSVRAEIPFRGWKKQQELLGEYREEGQSGVYRPRMVNGRDTLYADYGKGILILPETRRAGYEFGGWCKDSACTQVVGTAGDAYAPDRDEILYAKWTSLKLLALENYQACGGRGAVDLSWNQDGTEPKVYLAYQSLRPEGEFKKVFSSVAGADGGNSFQTADYQVPGDYVLVVPSSGFYEITVLGAQGGHYEDRLTGAITRGGRGGRVIERMYLRRGQTLHIQVGHGGSSGAREASGAGISGTGGSHYGGNGGSHGGGGGGASALYVAGVLTAMAGGGGGAGLQADGGAGGSEISLGNMAYWGENGGNYADGAGGGGGGMIGGKAGHYSYLFHDHSYYGCAYHTHSGDSVNSGPCYQLPSIGWKDCGRVSWTYSYCHYWWDTTNNCCNRCGGTNPWYLGHKDAVCEGCGWWLGAGGDTLAEATLTGSWFDEPQMQHRIWTVLGYELSCPLQEGYLCGYQAWDIDWNRTYATSAGGGSNFWSGRLTYVLSDVGIQSGNGRVQLRALSVGYTEELSLKGVPARDWAAPERIDENKAFVEEDKNNYQIRFLPVEDRGTDYYHQVKSVYLYSGAEAGVSNMTITNIKTGTDGYWYVTDFHPDTVITESVPASRLMTESLSLPVKNLAPGEACYLHIAPVDKAGNLGVTSHIMLGTGKEINEWKVYTEALAMTGGYYEPKDGIYYMKADGSTPVTIAFDSYCIRNDGIYEAPNLLGLRLESREGEQIHAREAARRYQTGEVLLNYAYQYRQEWRPEVSRLRLSQQFTMPAENHGREILLYPFAALNKDNEEMKSMEEVDRKQAIRLVGDAKPPEIRGLESLREWCEGKREEADIQFTLEVSDALSGVDYWKMMVITQDGTVLSDHTSYTSTDTVVLEDAQWYRERGSMIQIMAMDKVGNVAEVRLAIDAFFLTGKIQRILPPHEPIFKEGESGILYLETSPSVDRLQIVFPTELTELDPGLNQEIELILETVDGRREEALVFQIPMDTPWREDYYVEIYAYSGGVLLNPEPERCYFQVKGSLLEDLRTRLR